MLTLYFFLFISFIYLFIYFSLYNIVLVLPYIDMNMPLVYKGGKKDTFNVPCVVLDSKCIVLHKNYNTWEFQYYSNTKKYIITVAGKYNRNNRGYDNWENFCKEEFQLILKDK